MKPADCRIFILLFSVLPVLIKYSGIFFGSAPDRQR